MPTITFIHPGNGSEDIEASDGDSVMLAAMVRAVDGILGECGGCAVCGSCHVYVMSAGLAVCPQLMIMRMNCSIA
jgi:ferredoxin, 2Fe-2S